MSIDRRAATQLATRMIGTWPNGPKQGVWFDVLADLDDLAVAEHAYKLLRDSYERTPTVAVYRAEYLRLVHAAAAQRHPSAHRPGRTAPPWLSAGMTAGEWTLQQRLGADRLAL